MKKRVVNLEAVIENQIKDLLNEIEYEERKLECCAFGQGDLMYIESLKEEVARLELELDKLCA